MKRTKSSPDFEKYQAWLREHHPELTADQINSYLKTRQAKATTQQRDNGQLLKEQRASLNLTQTDLANIFGVDTMTLSRWERGARIPPWPLVNLALEALQTNQVNARVERERKTLTGRARRLQNTIGQGICCPSCQSKRVELTSSRVTLSLGHRCLNPKCTERNFIIRRVKAHYNPACNPARAKNGALVADASGVPALPVVGAQLSGWSAGTRKAKKR